MDVLQDLFEDLAVAGLLGAGALEVSEVGALAAGSDVLQVRSAAESAGDAAQDHGAHGGVAGESEAGLAKVAGGLDVERVETFRAIDRQKPHAAVALHADVRHGRSPARAIVPGRLAGTRWNSLRSRSIRTFMSAIAPVSSGPQAVSSIHSWCAKA